MLFKKFDIEVNILQILSIRYTVNLCLFSLSYKPTRAFNDQAAFHFRTLGLN